MPLHPLHRKLGPQATPRALGGLKFRPLASLISRPIGTKFGCAINQAGGAK